MVKLEKIRKTRGISQQEIAEIINSSQAKVSRIEKNINRLDSDEIVKLCNALNCSADYLLGLIDIEEKK